jgi:hypothetical protein
MAGPFPIFPPDSLNGAEGVGVLCTSFASFRFFIMSISASEGYLTGRPESETSLLPRLDALHVPDGDQAGTEVFAEVGLAADADTAGEEGLGVEAGRDVEIGDRRALAANQGEDLVAVNLVDRLAKAHSDTQAARAARSLMETRMKAFHLGQREHDALFPSSAGFEFR